MVLAVTEKRRLPTEKKLEKINDDFVLWSKNFVKITNNNGDLVQFKMHKQQKEFYRDMEKFNVILKARQLGFTTLSLALCLYYACTRPRTNYLILSYKADSATSLFDKLKQMNDDLPRDKFPHNFPKILRDNRNELVFDNGSRVQCMTSGRKAVGRGSTFEYILLSEFAFYDNQEETLVASEQALAKNDESRLVIESTANGFNYYNEIFIGAYRNNSKYKAFFYPFYSSSYSKLFRQEYREAEQWYKDTNYKRGLGLESADLTHEQQELYESGATLKQLMWKEWKLTSMSLDSFNQEFPANAMEAFVSTGNNVFDSNKVSKSLVHALKPLRNIDGKVPNAIVKYLGKGLNVYELPKQDVNEKGEMVERHYFGGVDTASGSGGDYSTISIVDAEGRQVLAFNHNKIPVYEFSKVVNAIGRWFNYAYLVVERQGFGIPVLERLRSEYNYMNLHKHKIFQENRHKIQLGFNTTTVSKNIMISDLKESFELGTLQINDVETLEQMQIFVQNSKGQLGNKNKNNYHDDLVIAIGLAIQGIKTNKWYV